MAAVLTCRCGHDREAHRHHRPGSDCGSCGGAGCPRFRPVHPVRYAAARVAEVVRSRRIS